MIACRSGKSSATDRAVTPSQKLHQLNFPGSHEHTVFTPFTSPTATMKLSLLLVGTLALHSTLNADDFQPQLFRSIELVYEDDFTRGPLSTDHWQVRQGSTWEIKDGVLIGSPSPKDYQDKKVAEGDPAHAGFKPVIWLEKVPEDLVVRFRARFDAQDYHPRFPLIDIGHHVNTLHFAADVTTLTLKKNKKTIQTRDVLFPLNEWVDVTIELKQGSMLLKLNDQQVVFSDPLIDMIDQQQIDFKGVDHGGIRIDQIKVFRGLP